MLLGAHGFIGDTHAGEKRISRRTGKLKWNDRQISLVGKEAIDYLNKHLSLSLKPGDLAENITTEGLGDLSNLREGHILIVGGVVFVVTEQNDPCSNLALYHKLLVKESYGRRGVLAVVERGAGVLLRPGMTIDLIDKAEVLSRANKIVLPYGLSAEFLEGIYSVGVQGDERSYLPVLCLIGSMRVDDPHLPQISNELTNTLPINRVTLEMARG
ncbi:MAG: hypothetical protein A3J54_00380 [Candidatus Ryanbacteria bacterium RIFCSPHIGHO2_02_FULL_45_13b]|uniref:MOSC domain-containing protein n=1 Tax=Candidatus Ryanbacteria bacterium RIFCSPHIGHO2_02_FULL_45_13b TaxID=1802117 RepID=A0A1G2G3M7_9BACT|nr:MAG: hypothetical protein A3J54_00380 [Candidatus Ryanbacteria bacterium RIFCSPHIGHO2_02_FULL_45_13b]